MKRLVLATALLILPLMNVQAGGVPGVVEVNGCYSATADDLTGSPNVQVNFGSKAGNIYVPKCIRVSLGTTVTFFGNFTMHPLLGGTVEGGVLTPAVSGPFVPVTDFIDGNTKDFIMNESGTFPYYCTAHGAGGMNGVVFVDPELPLFRDGFEVLF